MKPILFNTMMVQALIEKRKSQTRRNPLQPPEGYSFTGLVGDDTNKLCAEFKHWSHQQHPHIRIAAKYNVGDVLYVREAFRITYPLGDIDRGDRTATISYKAGGQEMVPINSNTMLSNYWRPSIHMPRQMARLFLRVKNVRFERLNKMTQDDAVAEGCFEEQDKNKFISSPLLMFYQVWNSTVKQADAVRLGWNANPYVWVYEFEQINKAEALIG